MEEGEGAEQQQGGWQDAEGQVESEGAGDGGERDW